MKKLYILLLIIFLLTINCSSYQKSFHSRKYPTETRKSYSQKKGLMIFFHSRKYPTETRKSYSQKKGLMILNNTSMERNKALFSKHNIKTKKKAYKKYKKSSRWHRFNKI